MNLSTTRFHALAAALALCATLTTLGGVEAMARHAAPAHAAALMAAHTATQTATHTAAHQATAKAISGAQV